MCVCVCVCVYVDFAPCTVCFCATQRALPQSSMTRTHVRTQNTHRRLKIIPQPVQIPKLLPELGYGWAGLGVVGVKTRPPYPIYVTSNTCLVSNGSLWVDLTDSLNGPQRLQMSCAPRSFSFRSVRVQGQCRLTSTETIRTVRVQCCLTSTETIRTVRDGESRTANSTFTQLLSSVFPRPLLRNLFNCRSRKGASHFFLSWCFTFPETIRLIRDGVGVGSESRGREPRPSRYLHSS